MKNRRFWKAKIMRNAQRDAESTRELEQSGWRVVTIWECELKSKDALTRRLGEVVAG
jgi:DNA mismatch endonuclease (patch repair protein)